jgi:hypothetical protein
MNNSCQHDYFGSAYIVELQKSFSFCFHLRKKKEKKKIEK